MTQPREIACETLLTGNVFFVTSHGSAGDYYFDWFAKALCAHPEIMIYMGESIRQKYLNERSRKERPDLKQYISFLSDLGTPYAAIGECYSYRAYQLEALEKLIGNQIRFINLVRHPYVWLNFYINWRCSNMRMAKDQTGPLDHEWNITMHDVFKKLDLKPYSKKDVHIWSAYQGMSILNRMVSDMRIKEHNICIEDTVRQPELFNKIVEYLTAKKVTYDKALLVKIYSWLHSHLKNGILPEEEFDNWAPWKKEAFKKILTKDAMDMFLHLGYKL